MSLSRPGDRMTLALLAAAWLAGLGAGLRLEAPALPLLLLLSACLPVGALLSYRTGPCFPPSWLHSSYWAYCMPETSTPSHFRYRATPVERSHLPAESSTTRRPLTGIQGSRWRWTPSRPAGCQHPQLARSWPTPPPPARRRLTGGPAISGMAGCSVFRERSSNPRRSKNSITRPTWPAREFQESCGCGRQSCCRSSRPPGESRRWGGYSTCGPAWRRVSTRDWSTLTPRWPKLCCWDAKRAFPQA